MTLHEYITALRRHWVAIVVLAIIGGFVGYGWAATTPDQYRSTASVMIIPERGDNTTELVQGSNYVQNLVQSYATLATKPVVLEPVVEKLGLTLTPYQLADSVTVNAPLETVVIDISVVNRDPLMAHNIAAEITTSLASAVTELSPQGVDNSPAVRMAIIAPARMPTAPFAPNVRLYIALGLGIGALIGLAYALAMRLVNNRIIDPDDVTSTTDVPLLGEIIQTRRGTTVARSILLNPDGQVAEAFRSLSANLKFVNVDGSVKVLLISSGQPGEGKSSIATGLALAMAESGHRVLLVDADLRRPSIDRLTQLEGAVGVTSVLLGEVTLSDAVQSWGHEDVSVLTSGQLPPNPGQLLASGQLRHVIDEARELYDFIIIDSPPVLTVSDALWMAPLSDGVMVVTRTGKSTRRRLLQSVNALRSSHADVLGVILNGVKGRQSSPYYVSEVAARDRRSKTPSQAGRAAPESVATGS